MAAARFVEPPRSRRFPRTDRHVVQRTAKFTTGAVGVSGAAGSAEEPAKVVCRHRKVGIAQEPPLAQSDVHAPSYRSALTAVRRVNEPDPDVCLTDLRDDSRSRVGRAIVHNKNLPGPVLTRPGKPGRPDRQIVDQLLDRRRDSRLFVIGGNDNAEIRLGQDTQRLFAKAGITRPTSRGPTIAWQQMAFGDSIRSFRARRRREAPGPHSVPGLAQ